MFRDLLFCFVENKEKCRLDDHLPLWMKDWMKEQTWKWLIYTINSQTPGLTHTRAKTAIKMPQGHTESHLV
jgi:hypothetical protein